MCAVYDTFIMYVCLAGWGELNMVFVLGICLREFGMDINGDDEWHPILNCY